LLIYQTLSNFIVFILGHKLASKIKSNINVISKQIEVNISHYEYFRSLVPRNLLYDNYPEAIFDEIVNYTSNFWQVLDISIDGNVDIPRIVIFNSIKNFNNLQRSKEEISLITQELDRLYNFWMNQKLVIENKMKQLQELSEQTYVLKNVCINYFF
jgi:flagellin-specific chaperone FliS